jgi:signal transduction histidine kinase
MRRRARRITLDVAALVLALVVLVVDLSTPAGVAVGVLYAPIICIVAFSRVATRVWVAGGAATVLTLVGVLASPDGGDPRNGPANRMVELIAIWTTTYLAARCLRLIELDAQRLARLDEDKVLVEDVRDELALRTKEQSRRARVMASVMQDLTLDRQRMRDEIEIRQAIQEALEEKTEELEQLLYVMSHDLKSPLVTVSGFATILTEHLAAGQTDKAQEAAERVHRGAATMNRLIDDLLEISRVGTRQIVIEDVDVAGVVADVVEALEAPLAQAGAVVQVEAPLPTVRADRSQLVRVFLNLVGNAIKYGCQASGGEITIAGLDGPKEVRLVVRDHGPGIDPKHHERIFQLFQRLSVDERGTGLGLATVAKVMDRHDGRAWVESRLGDGASFWLAFPKKRRLAPPGARGVALTTNGVV